MMRYKTSKMHVLTVATQSNRHLERLEASAKKYDIDLIVLGMGDIYKTHGKKIALLLDYIDGLPDEDIVLYVDAYDVMFLDEGESIKSSFIDMKVPLLFAAEYSFAFNQQFKGRNQLMTYLKYPQSKTGYRFLNAGTFMGYIKAFRDLCDTVALSEHDLCDQAKFSEAFVYEKTEIELDYTQTIFSCNGGRGALEEKDYGIEKGRLYAKKTDNYPKILHIPGKLYPPLDRLALDLLGLEFKGDYSDFEQRQYKNAKEAFRKADFFRIDPFLYFLLEKVVLYALVLFGFVFLVFRGFFFK